MAKKHFSTERKNTSRENILKDLAKFKNPFGSNNPFKDGQIVEFDDICEIAWENSDGYEGSYLALAFIDNINTISFSSFTKEVEGYDSKEEAKKEEIGTSKDFKNPDEGLAAIFSKYEAKGLCEELLNEIDKYLKCGKKEHLEIRLTYYYINVRGVGKKCSLTNIVKVKE